MRGGWAGGDRRARISVPRDGRSAAGRSGTGRSGAPRPSGPDAPGADGQPCRPTLQGRAFHRLRQDDIRGLVEHGPHPGVADQLGQHATRAECDQRAEQLVLDEPRYGYALLRTLGDAGLDVEANTLYPLLRRLEAQGLLESDWNTDESRPRKFYRITAPGTRVRDALEAERHRLHTALSALSRPTPPED